MKLILALMVLISATSGQDPGSELNYDDSETHCHHLEASFCEGLDYKTTSPITEDIKKELNQYEPLLKTNCSENLKLFLCSAHIPMCFDQLDKSKKRQVLEPCRSFCESIKDTCLHWFKTISMSWPANLNCERFPQLSREEPCVHRNTSNHIEPSIQPPKLIDIGFICPENFKVPFYNFHLNEKTYKNCSAPCENYLLDRSQTNMVRYTIVTIASISLLSTLFTIITYCRNSSRFIYPIKPIIIIAFCQLIVATCFIIGFLTDNRIACDEPAKSPIPNMSMIRPIVQGNRNGYCTLLFMALYFFHMSSMLWWLMIGVSWFMIARLRWAPEAIDSVSKNFHMISWAIPALMTTSIAVSGQIEGDPFTGVCHVNSSNLESTQMFITYPLLFCLLLNSILLFSGFKSLWDSRDTLKVHKTEKHDKMVLKMALFSIAFFVVSTLLLFCNFYQQSNLSDWIMSWISTNCEVPGFPIPCPSRLYQNSANPWIFILKNFSTMSIGILTGLFLISEKTLKTYHQETPLMSLQK